MQKITAATVAKGEDMIMDHALLASGAGLVPVPFADMMIVIAINVKMLHSLCDLYGLKFSKYWARAVIGSFLAGFHISMFSGIFLKFVPAYGALAGAIPTAAMAGSVTYAIGRVVAHHFALGGRLIDFDPKKVQAEFAEHYKVGQQVVADMARS